MRWPLCTDRTEASLRATGVALFHSTPVNRLFLTLIRSLDRAQYLAPALLTSPMKIRTTARQALSRTAILLTSSVLTSSALTATTAVAQATAPALIGAWRADTPLPNGVVQTFSFTTDGSFDLTKDLSVDGTYQVDGNRLIETVTLPSVGASHTDTATFAIAGDSLVVNEQGTKAPRVLHRSGSSAARQSIIGDWTIQVGSEMAAHYAFDANGSMHVRARVGDEKGKYVVRADTLHLSNDESFELPAIAQFVIADSVLTLTPPSGKQARHFHKVQLR
ncbi:MAG: hypothetical protein ABI035_05535 [Gemmatimonadaceae bacterium]